MFLSMNDVFLFYVKVAKYYFINIQITKLEMINYWTEPYFIVYTVKTALVKIGIICLYKELIIPSGIKPIKIAL